MTYLTLILLPYELVSQVLKKTGRSVKVATSPWGGHQAAVFSAIRTLLLLSAILREDIPFSASGTWSPKTLSLSETPILGWPPKGRQ